MLNLYVLVLKYKIKLLLVLTEYAKTAQDTSVIPMTNNRSFVVIGTISPYPRVILIFECLIMIIFIWIYTL